MERYGVDFFLVDRSAFDASTAGRAWAGREFAPFHLTIAARLNRPRRYALQDLADRCAVVDDGQVALVPASCLGGAR